LKDITCNNAAALDAYSSADTQAHITADDVGKLNCWKGAFYHLYGGSVGTVVDIIIFYDGFTSSMEIDTFSANVY
jgi:hypothetical protein